MDASPPNPPPSRPISAMRSGRFSTPTNFPSSSSSTANRRANLSKKVPASTGGISINNNISMSSIGSTPAERNSTNSNASSPPLQQQQHIPQHKTRSLPTTLRTFTKGRTREAFSAHDTAAIHSSLFLGSNAPSGTGGAGSISSCPPGVANAETVAAKFVGNAAIMSRRRYAVGEKLLVWNPHPTGAHLVNSMGFPEGEGETSEEKEGPYMYMLATVVKVHFEEDAQYYTVLRADNGMEERADTEYMIPLTSVRGQRAALLAATSLQSNHDETDGPQFPTYHYSFFSLSYVSWMTSHIDRCILRPIVRLSLTLRERAKSQAYLFLNGLPPYGCKTRVTMVNVLVCCSVWFVFCDQVSLAFFPPSADIWLGIISVIVWIVLVLELLFEIFIRPDHYKALLGSKEAYNPTTVRYINRFHVVFEFLALLLFTPEVLVALGVNLQDPFVPAVAARKVILSPYRWTAFQGNIFFAFVRLRICGLVRHWKMWVNNTLFITGTRLNKNRSYRSKIRNPMRGSTSSSTTNDAPHQSTCHDSFIKEEQYSRRIMVKENKKKKKRSKSLTTEERLINAANIGTALMVINSHRAIIILFAIVGFLPVLIGLIANNTNPVDTDMVAILQGTNLAITNTDADSCNYLREAVYAWMMALQGYSVSRNTEEIYVMRMSLLPVRCDFQSEDGVVTGTFCDDFSENLEVFDVEQRNKTCEMWEKTRDAVTVEQLHEVTDVRLNVISRVTEEGTGMIDGVVMDFKVDVDFNHQATVGLVNFSSFLMQFIILVFVLVGLSVLRADTGRLVLHPLRRMLKIMSLYSKNPLVPPTKNHSNNPNAFANDPHHTPDVDSDNDSESSLIGNTKKTDQLGNYETEQLINAITKITDLLRKCWGVAGAGIISHNLARQQDGTTAVFNPCVPGKLVYAVFSFAAISNFEQQQNALKGDIMILINDVAAVLHGEVYRWGLGNSGQCNKNLGNAFVMVFRIGDAKEVIEKKDRATSVIFASKGNMTKRENRPDGLRKRPNFIKRSLEIIKEDTPNEPSSSVKSTLIRKRQLSQSAEMIQTNALKLSSLPGINAFTDRALIGMLKAFAAIYRNDKIRNWKNDFRLGCGIGAFSVEMIIGMHAGWAVEGAVGSEYKIDATYLSPHVNMASRMMSACKQYGVSILLSEKVEELLSERARSKVRHLDTVTVKGSSVKQKIYTYDARHKGVDFFLFQRSEEIANRESDNYSPSIWDTDQDLLSMRQHVSEEFETEFNAGRTEYINGNWQMALKHFRVANEIMIETVIEYGYLEQELHTMAEEVDSIRDRILSGDESLLMDENEKRVRNEMGDGACRCLINYMEGRGGISPDDWQGYRPLTSK